MPGHKPPTPRPLSLNPLVYKFFLKKKIIIRSKEIAGVALDRPTCRGDMPPSHFLSNVNLSSAFHLYILHQFQRIHLNFISIFYSFSSYSSPNIISQQAFGRDTSSALFRIQSPNNTILRPYFDFSKKTTACDPLSAMTDLPIFVIDHSPESYLWLLLSLISMRKADHAVCWMVHGVLKWVPRMSVPFRSLAVVTSFQRYRVSLCESESALTLHSIIIIRTFNSLKQIRWSEYDANSCKSNRFIRLCRLWLPVYDSAKYAICKQKLYSLNQPGVLGSSFLHFLFILFFRFNLTISHCNQ